MTGRSNRRRFLAGTTGLGVAALATNRAAGAASDGFRFEVTRTEAEWKAILSDEEYAVLRQRETEWPASSPLWDDYREGAFFCKGCRLPNYSSEWRVRLTKGWVFFAHSHPRAVLTDIDTGANYSMNEDATRTHIEAQCRRCGSHLGHILIVDGKLVHCINGTSLIFEPSAA